jgi:hypothetical protein
MRRSVSDGDWELFWIVNIALLAIEVTLVLRVFCL